MVAFRRVWDRVKPIPRITAEKCSEHNPKIGPLTDLHTRWHCSYFSSTKRSSYKNHWKPDTSGLIFPTPPSEVQISHLVKGLIRQISHSPGIENSKMPEGVGMLKLSFDRRIIQVTGLALSFQNDYSKITFFFIRASSSRLIFNDIRFFVKLLFPSITSLSPTMWWWGNLQLFKVLDFARWPNQAESFHWKTMKVLSKRVPGSMARIYFGLEATSSKISRRKPLKEVL